VFEGRKGRGPRRLGRVPLIRTALPVLHALRLNSLNLGFQ
jgi:hypothetical protein